MRWMVTALGVLVLLLGGSGLRSGDEGTAPVPVEVAELGDFVDSPDRVTFVGEVSLFGELLCPCFMVTSDGASAMVWYDLTDTGGTAVAPESLASIVNGATVRVEGEVQVEPDPGTGMQAVTAISIEQVTS